MSGNFRLTAWQKKQAALLYLFSSTTYLEGLKGRVRDLRLFAEGILDTSHKEGRDSKLRSRQWGNRNTGENWENNAWPFLADFQRSISEDIANRASNIYNKTSTHQCARGMAEYSMQWSTPDEERQFDSMFSELSRYSRYIDQTLDRTTRATRWTDFGLTLAWQRHSTEFPTLPKMLPRVDLVAESGQLPPKTGIYVALDDPHATLQFAWTGSVSGGLLDATTFNTTGKSALSAVGRARLWLDGDAMLRFVLNNLSNPDLTNDSFFEESRTPDLAPSLVARNAFTSHPSRWCYVELVKDEFEPVDFEADDTPQQARRFDAGEQCKEAGFYFSPAETNSRRYFEPGEWFPHLRSEYGKTIWQWDHDQDK